MTDTRTAIQEIETEGFCVLRDLVSGDRLRRLQDDAERLLESTPIKMPGLDEPLYGRMCKQLFKKSRAFDDIYTLKSVLDVVESALLPKPSKPSVGMAGIQLSTVMIKDVVPRESVRAFHQDDGVYPIARPHPPLVINTLLAIDPFVESTGATCVVRGSHKWLRPIEQDIDYEIVEMEPGSLLMFDGAIWHRNGSNSTNTRYRRALNIYYSCRWLRPIEGPYLGLSTRDANRLPRSLQSLL